MTRSTGGAATARRPPRKAPRLPSMSAASLRSFGSVRNSRLGSKPLQTIIDIAGRVEIDPRVTKRHPVEALPEQPAGVGRRAVIVRRQRAAYFAPDPDVAQIA